MHQYCKLASRYLLLLLFAFIMVSCSSHKKSIKETVRLYCQSRINGDLELYRAQLGGRSLELLLTSKNAVKKFERIANYYKKNEILFDGIFITSIEVNLYRMQALAKYIEKLKDGKRSWAYSHVSRLEYIDGKWRVIADRRKKTD